MAEFVTIIRDEIYDKDRSEAVLMWHARLLTRNGKGKEYFVRIEGGHGTSPYRIVLYRR